jgi:hypothetical protein
MASPAASDMSDAYRPDALPNPYLSFSPAFSSTLSLWRFGVVVCGGRIRLFDWQAGARGRVRGKRLTHKARRCQQMAIVAYGIMQSRQIVSL